MAFGSRTLVLVQLAGLLATGVASAQPSSGSRCGAQPAPASPPDLSELSLEELMEIRTTVASTHERSIFYTPSTVTVVDRDMIRRYGFRSVAEAVNTIAGFATVRTSSRIDVPTGRGILEAHYANKILLMIDGVATWQPVTGDTTLARVDIADVERIEVLRGPSSVLYGTNGYSGAINIVTRCPTDPGSLHGSVYGGAGTGFAMRGGASVVLADDPLSLFVGVDSYDEHGDQRFATDADGVSGWYRDFRRWSTATVAGRYLQHSFLFNGYDQDHTSLGRDPTFAFGWGEPENLAGYLVNYTFGDRLADAVDLKAGATFDWNRRTFARAAGYDFRTNVVGHREAAFADAIVDLPHGATVEIGADLDRRTSVEYRNFRAQQDETVSESNLRDRTIDEASIFSQIGIDHQALGLLAGTRLTYNQLFGANLSSRATAVYAFDDHDSVKLIFGQSYRAPSLFELYFMNPERSTSGNSDVDPETSDSLELAYLTSFEGVFVQALAYYARYQGTLYRAAVPVGTILADGQPSTDPAAKMYANGPSFGAIGVELEYRADLGPVSSFGTYTFVRGLRGDVPDDAAYYNFDYVPRHKVVIGVSAGAHGAFASVAGVYLSSMHAPLPDASGSTTIAGQLQLDLTLGYDHRVLAFPVHHTLTVKNLANTETVYPDYVDLALARIPYGQTRRILYEVSVEF